MLSVKERIFLTLGFASDILENIGSVGGLVGVAYDQVYGFIPSQYKKHNFSASLSYALKTKEIEKVVKNGQVYYRLTGKGEKKLIRDFPLVSFQKKPWDGKWRILIYDIEETQRATRDALRRKVVSLGFGMLQKSIYISPFPIEREMADFLEDKHLSAKVLFLITDKIFSGGDRFLAESIFKVSKINEKYLFLLKEIKDTKDKDQDFWKRLRTRYLDILSKDPFLPKDLLPIPWYGEEAAHKMKFK